MDSSGGELAYLEFDANLPFTESTGIGIPANVVKVADKSGATRLVYHTPSHVIGDVTFVNGGRQLVMVQVPAFNAEAVTLAYITFELVVLDRSGVIRTLPVTAAAEVLPAPDGFVLHTIEVQEGGAFVHVLDYYRDGAAVRLWSTDSAADSFSWLLVGVTPTERAAGLGEFQTVTP